MESRSTQPNTRLPALDRFLRLFFVPFAYHRRGDCSGIQLRLGGKGAQLELEASLFVKETSSETNLVPSAYACSPTKGDVVVSVDVICQSFAKKDVRTQLAAFG